MKILFVRHGQSQDDLINAYGGWADFPLTPEGETQIKNSAEKIKALNISFEKIFTSPLSRAKTTANIISQALSAIPVEEFPFVKERNTYGILTGMNKDEAKSKYSEYVAALDNGEYVLGSERNEDINERAKEALKRLLSSGLENVIVISHSNFLKAFLPIVVGKKLVRKEDGGMVLIEVLENGNKVLSEDGIETE